MFNLVIKMEEGKIYEIVWDNDCFDCEDNCQEDLETKNVFDDKETLKYNNCYEIEREKPGNWEPKFYITWFGTDKDKRQLKTAGLAMTKFKHYSSGTLYSSIKELFD